ncbi:PTS sugar transporter subunit IIA [Cnuibacter physcomitrellae]|uniref:Phosphocarrier protein HPr n=1 Tax=Cnuibacter physcomitrellae TaxID=1619308 RepID=A0A1X9LMK2_9MICO|nr:dihydroxyacetone kinase phosphoryl donor subunit DhaM [Cnuibacter physcomitrellae]ARJ05171.1 PTS enzyme I [Cnuibacter physcomitrellae]GGI35111.1 PTS sugar transporter subunit IIA [Cnuibacter physcomitrellae]
MTERVGLVLVSHSAAIAEGLAALAGQMAPSTTLVPAGGTDDGGIGTSFDRVSAALAEAESGSGVVVLCDLGSAYLTAETALDFLDDEARASARIVQAPLVEGAVAAAVEAESGAALDAVVAAALTAWDHEEAADGASAEGAAVAADDSGTEEPVGYRRSVTIVNKDGLHARPAAEFVKLATTFPVKVTVNGTDAKSLLGIMSMGLTRGTDAVVATDDPAGREAVDALADLIEGGFGEA